MKVVIDTNVIVSALKSRRGTSFRIISSLPSSKFSVALSVPLYFESQEVLTRKGVIIGYSREEILRFLRYYCSICEHHEIFFLWRPILRDPKDDMVLELAVSSNSQQIVTHNIRDFRSARDFGVEAITPRDFINQQGGTI